MKVFAYLIAAGLAAHAGAASAGSAVRLAPSSKWTVDYAEDACRLKRVFGEGQTRTAFMLERFAPGQRLALVVAGPPFRGTKLETVSLRFGPRQPAVGRLAKLGELPAYEPAIIFPSIRLAETKDEANRGKTEPDEPEGTFEALARDELAVASGIEWLSVKPGGHDEVVLELGNMAEPMRALQDCTNELITHWGIDAPRHASLRRRATPANSSRSWMSDKDYPAHMLRGGMEGLVHFRLMIDANGVPTSCHVQASTRPAEFDAALCASLRRRARFKPALDAAGRPLPSYFRSTARFQIPE